ncbi:MAG: polysaccharide biosynthesis C-terminal domain-containing protein [Halioglobus sp.]
MSHYGSAASLASLAVIGQGFGYGLSIILARNLGVDGFEAYVVASAAFTLMVMYVPRGLEKYSIRILPGLLEQGDWGPARGYLQYASSRTIITALIVATLLALWVLFFSPAPDTTRTALLVSCLSLPTGALAHLGVEVLSAGGRTTLALAIFRCLVPGVALGLVLIFLQITDELSGALAVGSWGIAWALASVTMFIALRALLPEAYRTARAEKDGKSWRRAARPFLLYRVSLALISQAGVIALDALQPSAAAVGAYAAAIATASLPILLVTATNRYYAHQISLLLDRDDYTGILALRQQRLLWLLPVIAFFLAGVFLYGRDILAFFRPDFVEEGLVAMRILAVATANSVIFALAPTYMKYRGENRTTLVVVMAAAALLLVLLWILVPRLAATGAAISYAVTTCGMYWAFAQLAHRDLLELAARQIID